MNAATTNNAGYTVTEGDIVDIEMTGQKQTAELGLHMAFEDDIPNRAGLVAQPLRVTSDRFMRLDMMDPLESFQECSELDELRGQTNRAAWREERAFD